MKIEVERDYVRALEDERDELLVEIERIRGAIEGQARALYQANERIEAQRERLLEYDRELSVRHRLERAEQDVALLNDQAERLRALLGQNSVGGAAAGIAPMPGAHSTPT